MNETKTLSATISNSAIEEEIAGQKIKTLSSVSNEIISNKSLVILTKGVFDIFHCGHLFLFAFLEKLKIENQAVIIVSITSDTIVKTKKGFDRPFQSEKDRALQVAAIKSVDWVFINSSSNMIEAIQTLKPQLYVKGQDTSIKPIDRVNNEKCQVIKLSNNSDNPEIPYLIELGTKMYIYCDDNGISTTQLVKKILKIK